MIENKTDNLVNVFSNSFDESAPSLDLKLQRNCKSSTRMMKNHQSKNPSIPIPQLHNVASNSNGSGVLTAGSLNRKQGAFNNFMKTKQVQSTYQQAILSQLQMQRANTQNSFDMNNDRDLSNRSIGGGGLTPGGSKPMSNSFIINQYFGKTMNQQSNKPITPSSINTNNQTMHQMILSAGGQMPRQNQGIESTTMDPYTYLRWKQQKYKSCRSIHAHGTGQLNKQNAHIIANSAYLLQQRKGNQTQKTNHHNTSMCSSNGSVIGTASMTTTMTGIRSLSEVKNPSMFIQWRFSDRKLTELKDIGQFKNLTDLDISGNLLQTEIKELKQLQFLKKLNLSNNQISELYPLPNNLEILNISSNCLKRLNPDVTLMLKNLTTLDISNNGLENLEGLQSMKRLKRLLCQNNQVIDLMPLAEIHTIIEINMDNNPIDSFKTVLNCLKDKNDILVVNLKMAPIVLMINTYEQLVQEIKSNLSEDEQPLFDQLQKKLKFFSNGCLYRSKRVFIKIKTMQQHSKRSSSNFSNGSSSYGRAGANTGGRNNTTGNINNLNNNSTNAFSPLLNNTVTTPNYQNTTQRLEDIEQLYDEILDEEEEIERKQLRMLRRKLKKEGQLVDDDSIDDDEDESLYEDEDYLDPSLSCDEDIDLQSFRNHHHMNNDFLNESTADFNKEIRQINQELREGNELLGDNLGTQNQHLQSVQSAQSISTTKKNPISFKLDLSKCTQQQSEDEDFNNIKGFNDDKYDEDQFDIPGLQFIKVTEDSFRQMQKQQSQQQSLRTKLDKPIDTQALQENKKNTLRDYPPRPQQKPIIVPKLQLGVLQSNHAQQNIPLKQYMQSSKQLNTTSSKQSIISMKSFKNDNDNARSNKEVNQMVDKCTNVKCMKLQEEMSILQKLHESEKKEMQKQLQELNEIINQIKELYSFKGEIKNLLLFLKNEHFKMSQLEEDLKQMKQKYENIEQRCKQLEKEEKEIVKNKEEKERLIQKLQEELSQNVTETNPTNLINNNENMLGETRLSSFDLKRTFSTNYEQNPQLTNPINFYQTELQVKENLTKIESQEPTIEKSQLDKFNLRSRKRVTCDFKKVKRPQSVVGHRKSSYCVKINSLLRLDQAGPGGPTLDEYVNEYGSTQEHRKSCDRSSIRTMNQTMSKKVGHIIEKLKERNSSLQERLNGSFGSGQHPLPTKVSPLNFQKIKLNKTQQQDISCNPYIISPSNNEINQKNLIPQSTSNQQNAVATFSSKLLATQQRLKKQTQEHNHDATSSQNEYSGRGYNISSSVLYNTAQNQQQEHSKTQRIQIKRIQYNSFIISNPSQGEQQQLKDSGRSANNHKKGHNSSDYQFNLNLSLAKKDNLNPPLSSLKSNHHAHESMDAVPNFYQQKSLPQYNVDNSFRESASNTSSATKNAYGTNQFSLSSKQNK